MVPQHLDQEQIFTDHESICPAAGIELAPLAPQHSCVVAQHNCVSSNKTLYKKYTQTYQGQIK